MYKINTRFPEQFIHWTGPPSLKSITRELFSCIDKKKSIKKRSKKGEKSEINGALKYNRFEK